MAAGSGEATQVMSLKAVGHYALGVEWGDRHESIIPYRTIRRACPCTTCLAAGPEAPRSAEAEQVIDVQVLGGRSVFLRFGDGHESVLFLEEVRDLCRCARCAGEPEYPVSGR